LVISVLFYGFTAIKICRKRRKSCENIFMAVNFPTVNSKLVSISL
jgi:hypothetical protein